MTKDEAQRRRWTFYEAVMIGLRGFLPAAVCGGATFPGGTGDVDAGGRPGEPPWRDKGDLMTVVSVCLRPVVCS